MEEPQYTERIDDVSATKQYKGYAPVGSGEAVAVWQVSEVTISGAVTTEKWADGNKKFDNKWSDRATLTYV